MEESFPQIEPWMNCHLYTDFISSLQLYRDYRGWGYQAQNFLYFFSISTVVE